VSTIARSILVALLSIAALILPSCGSYRLVSTGGYQFDKTGELRTREESGALAAEIASLEVDHRFGVVQVLAADGAPTFEWKLSCWGRTAADADRLVAEIALERTGEGASQTLRLALPEDPGAALRGVESRLTLRVPAATAVALRNQHGGVEVIGIAGRVTGDCAHCAVKLEDLGAPVEFRTSFAELRALRIAGGTLGNAHGALTVGTVAGDLAVETSFAAAAISDVGGALRGENAHGALAVERIGGDVTAETSFASLTVADVAGRAELRNSHGSISTRAIRGAVDARTSFAGIEIECAGETAVVENSHGAIDLALTGPALRSVEAETSYADLRLRLPAGARPAVIIDQKHGELDCPIPSLGAANADAADRTAPRVELKVRHGDIVVTEG
jgi:hypothetical protein